MQSTSCNSVHDTFFSKNSHNPRTCAFDVTGQQISDSSVRSGRAYPQQYAAGGTISGIVTDSLFNYYFYEFSRKNVELGISTISTKFRSVATRKQWDAFLTSGAFVDYVVVPTGSDDGMCVPNGTGAFMSYSSGDQNTFVVLYGEPKEVEQLKQKIISAYPEVGASIRWVYDSDGNDITVRLETEKSASTEMYPFLGDESLESYYDRYLASRASILLLLGPPGTGKTTFIKGLLQHANASAVISYNEQALSTDSLFADFIGGTARALVIEDSDTMLRAREDGNNLMHRFLNVGDGLVSSKNKKIIFSTNLPSLRDVDEALLRPGRCFDTLTFGKLTANEAEILAKSKGFDFDTNPHDTYTIAEVFNSQMRHKAPTKSFGFA